LVGTSAAALGAVLAFAPAASALEGHGGKPGPTTAATRPMHTAAARPMHGAGHHEARPHGHGVVIDNFFQIAGGDIFNAGRDNTVGNGNGGTSGELPGEPTPSTVVKLEVSASVFRGLTLVSHEGSGDYPAFIPPAFRTFVPVTGDSGAVYQSDGGQGHVQVVVTAGDPQPNCTADGNLTCRIGFSSPEPVKPLLIEGR
jgi:hypothetical protein